MEFNMDELTTKITGWFYDRQIISNSSLEAQLTKFIEETEELIVGIRNKDQDEIEDAIGDCFVVLVGLAEINSVKHEGADMRGCVAGAWDEIKDRKGYLDDDGVFVKEE